MNMVKMREELYKGTGKILYHSNRENTILLSFTDKVKINNNLLEVPGKGVINNCISSYIMHKLDMLGIENHFINRLNMREQAVQFVEMFPIKVSVSTIASGRYIEDFKMEEGYVFESPIIDYKVKHKDLHYPPINEHQIINFGWTTKNELIQVKKSALRIYDFLSGLFAGVGVRLVQCNLEFGRVFNGDEFILLLADEISIDNCKLWDASTNEKLGLDSLTTNPKQGIIAYQRIFEKFNISTNEL